MDILTIGKIYYVKATQDIFTGSISEAEVREVLSDGNLGPNLAAVNAERDLQERWERKEA
jgi:hypothetical protein